MSDSIKEQIQADIQKAKSEGQLRADRIREIIRSAMFGAASELKAGSSEIGLTAREAIATIVDAVKEKGKDIREEVTAAVEGAIEGISQGKRDAIAKTETEIEQLQAQIETHEQELQSNIDSALTQIETASPEASSDIRSTIQSAVDALKDTEEAALMRKRYAQLQAQLAILRANLAARYGERHEDVKKHLETAKTWYGNALDRSRSGESNLWQQKQAEFEAKLSETGTALARKEKQVKQLLKELWQTITE
jgi:hypothetical protein